MYRHIYVAIDNSEPSTQGIDIAIRLARAFDARLTGCHVYAATLHERRFRQMESGLPEKYQGNPELARQRDVHDSLIRKGLELITDSYLEVFAERCRVAGVVGERRALEGKNYAVLLEDSARSGCDLVVLGAAGLGATADRGLGSVCERLLRKADTDLLIVKDTGLEPGPITIGVDGSTVSFAGVHTALDLGRRLNVPVEAVAAYDPDFHSVAFRSIAGVLSEEAGRMFHFREQEQLHEQVIDRGLARVYQDHLTTAAAIAKERGVELPVRLLSGKAFAAVLAHLRERQPWLLVVGRTGAHALADFAVGATCENLVRRCKSHVLVVAKDGTAALAKPPPARKAARAFRAWSPEATERLDRVPEGFMREAVRHRVLALAERREVDIVTPPLIEEAIAQGRETMSAALGGQSPGGTP